MLRWRTLISARRLSPVLAVVGYLIGVSICSSAVAQSPENDEPTAPASADPFSPAPGGSSLEVGSGDPAEPSDLPAPDETLGEAGPDSATVDASRVLELLSEAHVTLWPLGLCSIVAVGFALERWLALRRSRVIPQDFVKRFLDRLRSGKLDRERSLELCKTSESSIARVIRFAVNQWDQNGLTIRQIVAHDAAQEALDLRRNIRGLQGAATIAPLLGLFGTVIGLIQAFDALADQSGVGRGEALAEGISLALVATGVGLGVAIFSLLAYYHFAGRIDTLVREMDQIVREVIDEMVRQTPEPLLMPDPRMMATPNSATQMIGEPVPPTAHASYSVPYPNTARSYE